jgi:4-amino-4-deoxy-L-arabinose transferase-like glycosyltransferase
MWGHQGLGRVTRTVEGHDGGPFLPLLEVLEGGWPWLPLWPLGLARAWRERQERHGRWSLGLSLATAVMVLPIQTQLPWYSLLLWPPFCLICGPALAGLLAAPTRPRAGQRIPWFWCLLGTALVAISLLALGAAVPVPPALRSHPLLPLPAGLGLLGGGLLLCRSAAPQRRRGLVLLTAGWWLSLVLLFRSPLWNWELNENWPVRPVAELALAAPTRSEPAPAAIYLGGVDGERPSLYWYTQRRVRNLPDSAAADLPNRFLLIQREHGDPPSAGEVSIQLSNGAFCRLENPGRQQWNRWLCVNPSGAGHGPR